MATARFSSMSGIYLRYVMWNAPDQGYSNGTNKQEKIINYGTLDQKELN